LSQLRLPMHTTGSNCDRIMAGSTHNMNKIRNPADRFNVARRERHRAMTFSASVSATWQLLRKQLNNDLLNPLRVH